MGDEKGVPRFIPKRGPVKKFFKKILFYSIIGCSIYAVVAGVYATKTIYKVKTNYAVALEKFGGERKVVEHIGWHCRAPFFTNFEKEISLMQREMYFGSDITPPTDTKTPYTGNKITDASDATPHPIVSSDGISLLVSVLLTYKVAEPKVWAIDIENAESLLQRDFNGMVKDVLQSSTEKEIMHEREKTKNKAFQKLKNQPINVSEGLESKTLEKKYGIELVSLNIIDSKYPQNIQAASQRKKELELIADGESELTKRTYAAYTEAVKDFIEKTGLSKEEAVNYFNQQRWAGAYEKSKDQKTYVINNSNEKLGITIPTEESKIETIEELKQKIQTLERRLESILQPKEKQPETQNYT